MSLFSIRLTLTLKLYSPLAHFILFCFSLRTGEIASKVKSSTRNFNTNDALDQPLTPSQLLWGRNLPIMPPLLQPNTDDDSTTETKELCHKYFLISNALHRFRK